ncbi:MULTISPECIES: DUF6136 family protein [unclassified Pseudoalteromonas]|uniref:DUF6136 family protein n=1 Tax=unclassified Pseudoalteromonas TaxID=194690 RepID=UPI002096FCFF|nr:DUF6136 family protein [Pseudoalteromonas sp. XMcav2-N]MCO7186807.1 DUF6136 family protein [Pseudoalteromonas sp. XMcav2-N]
MLHYYQYRFRAFRVALTALLRQLQQFSLMFVTLFFIFIPQLIIGVFFGLGKLVSFDSHGVAMKVAFGFLLLQSLLLQAVKPAITDIRHRAYHLTLLRTRFHQFVADWLLLLVCHVLFGAALLLAVSMGTATLWEAPQLPGFMLAQWLFALALLYRPQTLVSSLCVAFVAVWLAPSIQAYLAVSVLWLALDWVRPRLKLAAPQPQLSSVSFWYYVIKEYPWMVLWRAGASFLALWAGMIMAHERPDLLHYYTLMILLVNQLWWSSLYLDTSKQVMGRRGFWRSLGLDSQIEFSQSVLIYGLCLISWLAGVVLLNGELFTVSVIATCPALVWTLKHYPQRFAVVWGCASVTLMMIKVLFI